MKKRAINFIVVILVIPFMINIGFTKNESDLGKDDSPIEKVDNLRRIDTSRVIVSYSNEAGEIFHLIFEPKNGHLSLRTLTIFQSQDSLLYFNDLTEEVVNFFSNHYQNHLGGKKFSVRLMDSLQYPYWEPSRISKREDVLGNDVLYFADAYVKDSVFYISGINRDKVASFYALGYPYFDNMEISKHELRAVANFIKGKDCLSDHSFDDEGIYEYFFYDSYSNCYEFFSDGYNGSDNFSLLVYFSKTIFEEQEKLFPYYYPKGLRSTFFIKEGKQGIVVIPKNFPDDYGMYRIASMGVEKMLKIVEENR